MNLEGRLLGNRYELIEQIGNGGMATVYKAKCHVLQRFVAVKILKDEFTTDAEFIKRFNTEAQAVASLTHPNIVSVFDVGKEGNLYYIVMELVQGKTLKEIIKEDGALSWKWSVNIGIQIASALETAHKNHIIHRDIKPHNIIITEEGIAKVTDFGIAKAVSNSTITAFGTTIGSVHYFSPEHARGGYTDEKSDIYSLGIVLYEMLTGRVPFDADTPVSVALKHMQEKPVEPILINPSVPTSVNRIVLKAMQKDVSQRYSSATDMLKDLNLSLKNPDGNFVTLNKVANDFPTQHVSILYDKTIAPKTEDTAKRTDRRASDKKAEKRKKAGIIIGIIMAAITLFLIAMFATLQMFKNDVPKEIEIPNALAMSAEQNKTVDEIRSEVEALGLKLAVQEEYNATVEVGKVFKQEPTAGVTYDNKKKTAKEGDTIRVWMSLGQKMVTVPTLLIGYEKAEVVAKIETSELKVEAIEEYSDDMETGKVLRVEPAEGTQISAGSTVKIYVSSGVEQVTVPDLYGKTEEEAKKALTDAKLKHKATLTISDSSKPNGKIVAQDIVSGSVVDKETPITITLNQFNEIKEGTLTINVKSILGYTPKIDEVTGEPIEEKAKLKVLVGKGDSSDDVVFNTDVNKSKTNQSVSISGTGTVTVRIYIDEILKKTVNFTFGADKTLVVE
ncbi:MAG: Stk1 family PASTA domain-containing Ser/Thr kinase [Lachnospiraceae bacterium]|jgi:serine/threonine-protein kinase|nr:Stk1 family PASTA domain-containing Ser/Thr kinase [Lachnospiraceae bacterium]